MSLKPEGMQEREAALRDMPITSATDDSGDNFENYMFVSYKSDDWKPVFEGVIKPMINEYGLKIYADKAFDENNESWLNQMRKNLEFSAGVILFISDEYRLSYATFIELIVAISFKKALVPICLADSMELTDKDMVRLLKNPIEMTDEERDVLDNAFKRINRKEHGTPLQKAAMDAHDIIELDLKNNNLNQCSLFKAFEAILNISTLQKNYIYSNGNNNLEKIYNTIYSVGKNAVFEPPKTVNKLEKAVPHKQIKQEKPVATPELSEKREQSVSTEISDNKEKNVSPKISEKKEQGVSTESCEIDWIGWKGKLPEVEDDSFTVEFEGRKRENCKNWNVVWRNLLELLGEHDETKETFLQLRDKVLGMDSHNLKTFFNGQVNKKADTQYTRPYTIESVGIQVENYWNKENMCKEVKKLCAALNIDTSRISIKGKLC